MPARSRPCPARAAARATLVEGVGAGLRGFPQSANHEHVGLGPDSGPRHEGGRQRKLSSPVTALQVELSDQTGVPIRVHAYNVEGRGGANGRQAQDRSHVEGGEQLPRRDIVAVDNVLSGVTQQQCVPASRGGGDEAETLGVLDLPGTTACAGWAAEVPVVATTIAGISRRERAFTTLILACPPASAGAYCCLATTPRDRHPTEDRIIGLQVRGPNQLSPAVPDDPVITLLRVDVPCAVGRRVVPRAVVERRLLPPRPFACGLETARALARYRSVFVFAGSIERRSMYHRAESCCANPAHIGVIATGTRTTRTRIMARPPHR